MAPFVKVLVANPEDLLSAPQNSHGGRKRADYLKVIQHSPLTTTSV